jgi:uncharacterized protein (DUF488 family)
VIRKGTATSIYTIGYERRDGEDLLSVLLDQGVKAAADIRERPISRKPDFRAAALREICRTAGIEYQPWPMLGSTARQREELHASGDFRGFADKFRTYALDTTRVDLASLGQSCLQIPTVLLCYERLHEDCHRSVIAEFLVEKTDATIGAIQ